MNPIHSVSSSFSRIGSALAFAVKRAIGLEAKLAKVLRDEKSITPALITDLSRVIGDVELLVSAFVVAKATNGGNFQADEIVWEAIAKLVEDFGPAGEAIDKALAILNKDLA